MKIQQQLLAILLTVLLAACASQPETDPIEEPIAVLEPTMVLADSDEDTHVEAENAETGTGGETNVSNDMPVYKLVAGESTLTYEVGEVFISQDNRFATAIGMTSDISGTISLDPANPQNVTVGTITADIRLFKSDSSKRDNVIQSRFLESEKYPQVTFSPTAIMDLPESYQPGETIHFQILGDTTIRETTLPLTFEVSAVLDGNTLRGQASTIFLMSDFGFGPISIAGILNTEDEVKIILKFIAQP